MTEIEEIWNRMRKKGGTIHASLKHGMVAYINGEKLTVLVEPSEYIPENLEQRWKEVKNG